MRLCWLLLSIAICGCETSPPCKPLFADYVETGRHRNQSFNEVTSSTGLKESLSFNTLTGNLELNNGLCEPYKTTFSQYSYFDNQFGFQFVLTYLPSTESNVISFKQSAKMVDGTLLSLRFHYALDKGLAYAFGGATGDGENHLIAMDISHSILDSIQTRYGTFYKALHIRIDDAVAIHNARIISDLYIDKKNGMFRFDTVEGTSWEFGAP